MSPPTLNLTSRAAAAAAKPTSPTLKEGAGVRTGLFYVRDMLSGASAVALSIVLRPLPTALATVSRASPWWMGSGKLPEPLAFLIVLRSLPTIRAT